MSEFDEIIKQKDVQIVNLYQQLNLITIESEEKDDTIKKQKEFIIKLKNRIKDMED